MNLRDVGSETSVHDSVQANRCYISVNKVPQMSQRLKIKVTPQTPGIKTQFFEYNPYKPIFIDYNFYFKNLRNIKFFQNKR
jgi:hypothetical protein